jgi:hypothetical protein
VVAIDGWGGRTRNCRIAVHHEDGTVTEGFIYNWYYSKEEGER